MNVKKERLYKREKYLSKIRPFYDTDLIKVITGIRRCGKSSILKSIIYELLEKGIDETQIIYLPLDNKKYFKIKTPEQLEKAIDENIVSSDVKYYLFIDEIQNVHSFESVVQAYQEEGYSLFLTGSNSYLLSDEITTKLTGRYLTFEVYTLDFFEFLEMKKFFNQEVSSNKEDEFKEFLRNGGFPKSLEYPSQDTRDYYLKEVIKEIFEKDVRSRNQIRNLAVYERIQSYLINNFSSPFSLTNTLDTLEKLNIKTKALTLRNYIEDIKRAKIVYECNRFDLKSQKSLIRDQKYYLADLSLYYALNTDGRINFGASLENLVYLYLVSNDYKVSFGKIGNFECDFIVKNKNNEYRYIQVVLILEGEDPQKIIEREYRPFRKIQDGYPRYLISLDRYPLQREGVIHINAIELFLGQHKI